MVIWRAVMAIMLLCLLPNGAQANVSNFDVTPAMCIAPLDEPCEINLVVSWHADTTVCLVDETALFTPYFCAKEANDVRWRTQFSGTLVLLLTSTQSGDIQARKEIRQLQSVQRVLQPRRLAWSLF